MLPYLYSKFCELNFPQMSYPIYRNVCFDKRNKFVKQIFLIFKIVGDKILMDCEIGIGSYNI